MRNLTSISIAGSADGEEINNNNNSIFTFNSWFSSLFQRFKSVAIKFNEAVATPVCGYFSDAVDALHRRIVGFQFTEAVAVPVWGFFNEAVDTLHRSIVVPVFQIFDYIGGILFRDEIDLMLPPSTFGFVIVALLAFTEIKSQSNPKSPFHPKAMIVSVNSVVIYGFASTVEVVILSAGFHRTSIFAIIARLGRIGCLNILMVSLATLFYF